jgi:gamma-glutamyltranspeptidase/glutathione hydrolase
VAAQGKYAASSAEEIYAQGGNIIDAAVAVSFAISVERPQSTGLGGGGFLLFREKSTGKTYAVDFRERAPLAASRDMYLDANGGFLQEKSLDGSLASATPGLVAGLLEIHKKWGKLPLAQVMAPAIRVAEKGFAVTKPLARALRIRRAVLARDPAASAIFFRRDGSPFEAGEKLVQKDLAATLRRIARLGRAGFYEGKVANAILASQRRGGGLITRRDLETYTVKWREPVQGTFRGLEIYSMPPPSSGGIHVLQILNMLENDPLARLGFLSPQAIHRTASALQMAFADRAVYPGDPDFTHVPVEWLISKEYAAERRATVDESRARPSSEVRAGSDPKQESFETTHFSILDTEGNAVASTQTVNYLFGSAVVAPGTGVLLNDEMDDFAAKPGAANVFGALGGEANSIAPGKTPLSSMSPTIVLKDGLPVMAVGAPGGTRIISCVAETILNYFAYGMPAFESVAALRLHHQWMPDVLEFEQPGPGDSTLRELRRMGWNPRVLGGTIPCEVELVVRVGGLVHAVSDPRDSGRGLAH